jgi:protein TonB
MLLQKTIPVYPPIAKAARVSGTVVLQATISKAGTIENLRVIGGPAMLQQAAMDAVRQWRYKPYLLNNEPVEVETTVNVIFSLGG